MLHNKVSHGYLHCGATFTNKCQNLLEQFPHLITDLPTVCFESSRKANPDKALILLVYEAHFSHIPQFTTLNPALAFDLLYIGHQIRGIIKMIVTLHPQRYKLKFTGQHYAVVACHSINVILKQYPNSLWQDFDLRFFYFVLIPMCRCISQGHRFGKKDAFQCPLRSTLYRSRASCSMRV